MYEFIKESSINHSKEVVLQHTKKLQPLNYNRFMWWRTHTDRVTPLGKRALLKDRILNGEFDPSSYFWQAQLALHTAKEKLDLTKHDTRFQIELVGVDLQRYKKLMEDFEKEEKNRMLSLYDAFTTEYNITKEELEERFLKFNGTILQFYYYAEEFLYKSPAGVRKDNRGRPKKVLNQPLPKVLQKKRGRPKKNI
jgi:hypothetical protein